MIQAELQLPNCTIPSVDMRGQLTNFGDIERFALAGNATITIRSKESGNRFTYRIRAPRQSNGAPIWFVGLLNGTDNENNYVYMGQIYANHHYVHGRKSRISSSAPGSKAFQWFWYILQVNHTEKLQQIEVWHEGRCGRCGRKLTVPESIKDGFGPECIQHVRN